MDATIIIRDGNVLISFAEYYIALAPEQARQMGYSLISAAEELDGPHQSDNSIPGSNRTH